MSESLDNDPSLMAGGGGGAGPAKGQRLTDQPNTNPSNTNCNC